MSTRARTRHASSDRPPFHIRSWMQANLEALSPRSMRDICMPGSHDSATYKMHRGTFPGGTEDNVKTQTKSIYEQLQLGVRWFDIRPCLWRDENGKETWATHHTTRATAAYGIGTQGGITANLDEIIEEVNRFTNEHAEVVILDLGTFAYLQFNRLGATHLRFDSRTHSIDLLNKLQGLQNVFRAERPASVVLHDMSLFELIGNGEAAVIVLMEDFFRFENHHHPFLDHASINSFGFYHNSRYSYSGYKILKTQAFSDLAVSITSTWLPWRSSSSIISLATSLQAAELPFALQQIAALPDRRSPVFFKLDNINDDRLLTLCLAVTFKHLNVSQGKEDPVIIYGGQRVTAPTVCSRVLNDFLRNGRCDISNEMLGGDPWPGHKKSLAFYHVVDGLVKGRWAQEGTSADFRADIVTLSYGGKVIRRQDTYYNLWRKLVERRRPEPITAQMLGIEPQHENHGAKRLSIEYRDHNGDVRTWKGQEGGIVSFEIV